MSAPDPKPPKRVKDPKLMRQLHKEYEGRICDECPRRGTQLHHIVRRSQGGADSRANLAWLCVYCHTAVHS